jgi:hypothetical protein
MGSLLGGLGRGLATDPNTGNVFVTGAFRGTTDFGGGPTASGAGGGATLFLAGYDPSGNYLWAKTWGGDTLSVGDCGFAVRVDASGNLAITGQFDSGMNFGGSWLPGKGYFVASFTISGNSLPTYRWAERSNTINNGLGSAVAFDTLGHLTTAGSFNYTTDFGGISATVPAGTTGAFVAQYGP